jgi:hypothetical protein
MPQVDEFGWHGRIVVSRWRVHIRLRDGGLVDGGRLPRPATFPVTVVGGGFCSLSTVENARKWQRLYPDKTEFTQICSGKYPTYVVGNYKSKKFCFFITETHNSNFEKTASTLDLRGIAGDPSFTL